jgi:hypothetical protein
MEKKEIPLDDIKDKLPEFDEKKELYKLRHYLHYHVNKKKKTKEKFEINHTPHVVKFD